MKMLTGNLSGKGLAYGYCNHDGDAGVLFQFELADSLKNSAIYSTVTEFEAVASILPCFKPPMTSASVMNYYLTASYVLDPALAVNWVWIHSVHGWTGTC